MVVWGRVRIWFQREGELSERGRLEGKGLEKMGVPAEEMASYVRFEDWRAIARRSAEFRWT